MKTIKKLIKGEISRRALLRGFLPLGLTTFFGFLLISRMLFPPNEEYPYRWTTSMISRLGWPQENPMGWVFFAIAFIWLGILLLMLAPYMFQKLSTFHEGKARVISFSIFISGTGSIGLGLIPNYPITLFRTFHKINAALLFMGIFLMTILCLTVMISDLRSHPQENQNFSTQSLRIFSAMFLYLIITSLMMAFSRPGLPGNYYFHDPNTPMLLSRPFWEWQAMLLGIGLIVMSCIMIPEKDAQD